MMDDNTKKRLEYAIRGGDFTLLDVVDLIIEMNGIIGVGLISLDKTISQHIHAKIPNKRGG